jgi:hypothetical protein
MMSYIGSRGIAPLILNLGTRYRRVVNFKPGHFIPAKNPLTRRLGKSQSHYGHSGGERDLSSYP